MGLLCQNCCRELPLSNVNKRPAVFLLLLIALSTSSMAMSLGRQVGMAIIGRPLDISVEAGLDSTGEDVPTCVAAEVFFGDNRVDASRVRVTSEPVSPGSSKTTIRIRSVTSVDEPVVSVNVRAGCQQKTERRYVLLADLAGETSSVAGSMLSSDAAVIPGARSRLGTSNRSLALPSDTGRPQTTRQSTVEKASPSESGKRPDAGAESRLVSKSRTGVTAAKLARSRGEKVQTPARARLKLEPMDLSIERDPSLRLSPELLSAPSGDDTKRSAAAALWRALTSQPDDILRDTEKLISLEKSVVALQSDMQKNKAALTDLNGQVQKAQSERYANSLVYLLAVLLAIAIAAVAYLLRRASKIQSDQSEELPWWRKNKTLNTGWASNPAKAGAVYGAATATLGGAWSRRRKSAAGNGVDVERDLQNGESAFGVFKRKGARSLNQVPPLQSRDKPEFAMSTTTMARAVKAEELFDVQQQADFFVSLGQHEQAIEVLQEHIASNVQTSALVYLDLFDLYHLLKRKDDYEALREDFGQLFNARMPEFGLYTGVSPGLEAYPAALDRIESFWPSPRVLEVIEESIFRKQNADTEVFDLGAYRELLLLYAVAREVIGSDAGVNSNEKKNSLTQETVLSSSAPNSAPTAIQPLSAAASSKEFSLNDDPSPAIPQSLKPAAILDLDLDLSAFPDLSNNGFEHTSTGDAAVSDVESDSRFFAQFEDVAMLPPAPIVPPAQKGSKAFPPVRSHLMDFEIFGTSDEPMDSSKGSKS